MAIRAEAVGGDCWTSLRPGTQTVYSDLRGKPDTDLWGLLTPEEGQAAGGFMPLYNTEHRGWMDVYPAEERLVQGARSDSESVLFVDVGGGNGSQAREFREAFPSAQGKVIVQDLPGSIPDSSGGVESMAHDFFTAQPVKGARAYYLRYIMHDWSDENNVKILSHLRDAMEPGYSRLLINDWLLSDDAASSFMTSMDLTMMSLLGGEERSEDRHREYIEAAGLKLVKVWDPKDGTTEAVFECEVA